MGSPVRNLEPDDPPSLSATSSPVAGATLEKEPDPIISDFSLFVGGPVYDFFLRIGLVRLGLPNILRRVVALVVLAWVPLLILSLRDGLAYGHRVQVPLLYDFWTYGRFVLCLPLLILAEVVIEGAVHLAVNEFVKSGLIQDAEMPDYKRVLHGMQRMRDAALPEIILLVLAFFPVFIFQHEFATPSVTTWHSTATGLTTAGWWFATVSTPIMRFMMFRWLFRYAIWAILLWRIGKLNLHLMPTHPDRAGGLDFLSISQRRFGILFCALGCAFAGQIANRMAFEKAPLSSFYGLIAGYLALSLIIGLLPLLMLTPKLLKLRRAGLLEYGRLANQYTEAFDQKWVHSSQPGSEPLLGTADIQSLADLGNSFEIVHEMQIAPVTRVLAVQLLIQAGLPLVPVVLVGTPTSELVKAIVKMIV